MLRQKNAARSAGGPANLATACAPLYRRTLHTPCTALATTATLKGVYIVCDERAPRATIVPAERYNPAERTPVGPNASFPAGHATNQFPAMDGTFGHLPSLAALPATPLNCADDRAYYLDEDDELSIGGRWCKWRTMFATYEEARRKILMQVANEQTFKRDYGPPLIFKALKLYNKQTEGLVEINNNFDPAACVAEDMYNWLYGPDSVFKVERYNLEFDKDVTFYCHQPYGAFHTQRPKLGKGISVKKIYTRCATDKADEQQLYKIIVQGRKQQLTVGEDFWGELQQGNCFACTYDFRRFSTRIDRVLGPENENRLTARAWFNHLAQRKGETQQYAINQQKQNYGNARGPPAGNGGVRQTGRGFVQDE